MEVTLQGLAHAASHYVDDLLVHSVNLEQRYFDLEQIFDRLLDSNLKLSPAKAKFLLAKITDLGIENYGIEIQSLTKKIGNDSGTTKANIKENARISICPGTILQEVHSKLLGHYQTSSRELPWDHSSSSGSPETLPHNGNTKIVTTLEQSYSKDSEHEQLHHYDSSIHDLLSDIEITN